LCEYCTRFDEPICTVFGFTTRFVRNCGTAQNWERNHAPGFPPAVWKFNFKIPPPAVSNLLMPFHSKPILFLSLCRVSAKNEDAGVEAFCGSCVSMRGKGALTALLVLLAVLGCGDAEEDDLDAAENLCQPQIDAFAACTERAIAGSSSSAPRAATRCLYCSCFIRHATMSEWLPGETHTTAVCWQSMAKRGIRSPW
jgi:hypothetical protein